MKIIYTVETDTNEYNEHGVTIKCNYEEFMAIVQLISAQAADNDIETKVIMDLEYAYGEFSKGFEAITKEEGPF